MIELLFVLIIMSVIAIIAIPLLFSTVRGSRPLAAVNNLRAVASAEMAYSSYAPKSYGRLADLSARNFLDVRFSTEPALLEEYKFTSSSTVTTFTCTATPVDADLPAFYVNHSGVVFYANGEPYR